MSADEVAQCVGREAEKELADALSRIGHCLNQLSEAQVWWRPAPSMNSIGNLLLHLRGNLRQWIVAGVGGAVDTRNRPAEFAPGQSIPKQKLADQLSAVAADAMQAMRRLTAAQLLAMRRIQGFDVTGMAAIIESIAHFRGHTQEIVHLTRLQLGDAYRFQWAPSTPEQGAPP